MCPVHGGFEHKDRFHLLAGLVAPERGCMGPGRSGAVRGSETVPWERCTEEVRLMSQSTQRRPKMMPAAPPTRAPTLTHGCAASRASPLLPGVGSRIGCDPARTYSGEKIKRL